MFFTASSKCFSTGDGNARRAAVKVSNSSSAFCTASACEIAPTCVSTARSPSLRKSSSFVIQSVMYIGRRFRACTSAKSRYATTILLSASSSSTSR